MLILGVGNNGLDCVVVLEGGEIVEIVWDMVLWA